MSDENPMVGKTIAEVIDRGSDYGGIDLIFTDGTAMRIDGDGYEDSCVTQSPLTPEDREREAREAEERREADRLAAIRLKARRAEEAEVKASRSPGEYEAWMDEHRQGWRLRLVMEETFRGVYADMVRSCNRQVFDGAGGFSVRVEPGSLRDTWGR